MGKIVDAILESGFSIHDMHLMQLDYPNVEEFLEIYKGVIQDYQVTLIPSSRLY
jgi:nucleoside diphosphate kinase